MRHASLVASALTFLVLTACGAAPAATNAPAPATAPTSAAPAATSAFPLTITHARGETTIEQPVARIVAISDEVADIVVASGLKPVGVGTYRVEGALGQPITKSGYFDMGGAVYVGDGGSPSLEAIAALKPDLIMYLEDRSEGMFEKFSAIAPTVSIDPNPKDYWRPVMQDLGRATSNEAQVQQFLNAYDAAVAKAREQVAPVVKESPNLALLYLPDASSTFVFNDRSSVTAPYVKLGFTMVAPAGLEIPESGFAQVSSEVIPDIKADTLVALRFVDEAGAPKPLPIDTILGSLKDVRIITQPLDPTRSSSAPLADKLALEQAATLLVGE